MRRTFLTLLAALVSIALTLTASASEPAKIKVLLVTGDDVSAHNWREMSQATREVLDASGKFDVKLCEDLQILDSAAALAPYDVIYFMPYTTKKSPQLTDQGKKNLLEAVRGGKGFIVAHLASASFADWDEFGKLCGRKWIMGKSGHGPRAEFEAKVVDNEHPITQGVDNFRVDDELYAKLFGDEPIHVLVAADSDFSKKTEPLLFTLSYGNGRVVHNAFGHDRKAITTPAVATLIVRSTQWAAGQ